MKSDNLIKEKSFAFAVRVVNACDYLVSNRKQYTIAKQLLRSGTSIGANVEESIGAQSTADFLHKISLSYKEARETRYWIKLLRATNHFSHSEARSLLVDIEELCRILGKIKLSIISKNKIRLK